MGLVWALLGSVAGAAAPPQRYRRTLHKIRPESLLRQDVPSARLDLRGADELERDRALVVHTRRVAALDVIVGLAQRQGDERLMERVSRVRRKEKVRFQQLMRRLHEKAMRRRAGASS